MKGVLIMTKTLRIFGLFFIFAFAFLALVGCAPKDSDAAKKKMDKAGYDCIWLANKEVGENGEVGTLTCTKKGSGDSILGDIAGALSDSLTAKLYDSSSNAKKALKETQNAEGKSSWQVVGKWLISGSEEAVKAFK